MLRSVCRPYATVADILAVNLGVEILKIVPGRVSTQPCLDVGIDALLSTHMRPSTRVLTLRSALGWASFSSTLLSSGF